MPSVNRKTVENEDAYLYIEKSNIGKDDFLWIQELGTERLGKGAKLSRLTTIAIRDMLNSYLEASGEIISAPVSSEPELELRFE